MVITHKGNDPGEATPKGVFLARRAVLRALGLGASVAATGGLYGWLSDAGPSPYRNSRRQVEGEEPVSMEDVVTPVGAFTHYNNYYEFSTDKREVAELAAGFAVRPWRVVVDGLVGKRREYEIDELLKVWPAEERVYRHRCVEGWSMVVPWMGISLGAVLREAGPLGSAKYVAFTAIEDAARLPGQKSAEVLKWPYVEGLRLDEAMHPLTILSHGAYGEMLLPQNGAPLRLVVPWKYGFKGIKGIVRMTLVESQPATTWNVYSATDYGFYSNVNPTVVRPRFSQRFEDRLGETVDRRPTLMFNGYGEEVAGMYAGMDLGRNF